MKTKLFCLVLAVGLTLAAFGQATFPTPSAQLSEKVTPSVAMVVIGEPEAPLNTVASAVVVRSNGILLTAYHAIKNARALQIRLSNGEVFDEVQLLGVDARRDVAAIRIAASNLSALSIATMQTANPGDPVYVISGQPSSSTASTGSFSAYRLAHEIPNAGSGYRLIQFNAPGPQGSNGAILVNAKAELIGVIVASNSAGKNLNYAVPVENVIGLAAATPSRNFGSGSSLKLESEVATSTPTLQQKAISTVMTPPIPEVKITEPSSAAQRPAEEDLAKSEVLKSKDPDFILRNFRTMYVDANKAVYFKSQQMKAALGANPEFRAMKIALVDDRYLADVVLEVGYTFAWDYPFTLRHESTSIVLLAGKGSGPFSGPAGADSVAKKLTKLLKPYRTASQQKPNSKD